MKWPVKTATVLLPKQDCLPSECEDALDLNVPKGRFAVADGATEAFDSGRWAKMLVKVWTHSSQLKIEREALMSAVENLGQRLSKKWQHKDLPWYAEEKARAGSYAAFAGLTINEENDGSVMWRSLVIGDSCIFHERNGVIKNGIPTTSPSFFSYTPTLLPSRSNAIDEALIEKVYVNTWKAEPGDILILLTDAISCWYLTYAIPDCVLHDEFHTVLTSGEPIRKANLIQRERSMGRLRNDDVAVLRVEVP
ncbi:MAG: hypothetical protein JW384_03085 [Nitrosomonadaceae bacterium]|nr:hypothetical protein [Nitrosomonadaceae bacterium]